nr:helix-turn-helix transcriptional regulator [Lachnospiraceae bacterium]
MNKKIISQLKDARIKKGLTQADVAKLTGLKNTTISNYENGISEPDIDTLFLLFKLYDIEFISAISDAYDIPISNFDLVPRKDEIELLQKMRTLDKSAQKLIVDHIDHEYRQTQALKRLYAYCNATKNVQRDLV